MASFCAFLFLTFQAWFPFDLTICLAADFVRYVDGIAWGNCDSGIVQIYEAFIAFIYSWWGWYVLGFVCALID